MYRAAVRDEIWIDGALVESRVSFGTAEQRGSEIVASDGPPTGPLSEACEAEMLRARAILKELEATRVRAVVRATSDGPVETTFAMTIDGVAIVTTPHHAIEDAAMLRTLLRRRATGKRRPNLPLVWRNGSAAVLLHEAAGHAAEHGHRPLRWPPWLRVRDGAADLLAGQPPAMLRRETFRDVPLPRMTNVVVDQSNAPFALPGEHIDIYLVAGGSYEPLTEMVTIEVAIAEKGGARLQGFEIRATRSEVAAALLGAEGPALRYPGVICSREGQELFVGSHAPVMITAALP